MGLVMCSMFLALLLFALTVDYVGNKKAWNDRCFCFVLFKFCVGHCMNSQPLSKQKHSSEQ